MSLPPIQTQPKPAPAGDPALDGGEMFELAPVSLWVEDFSAVKRLIDLRKGKTFPQRETVNCTLGDERGGEPMLQRVIELTELDKPFHGIPLLGFATGRATSRQGERLVSALRLADQRRYASKQAFCETIDHNRRQRDRP